MKAIGDSFALPTASKVWSSGQPAELRAMRVTYPLFRTVAVLAALSLSTRAFADDFELAPILYGQTKPANAVSRLQERIERGQAKLDHEDHFGYLRSVLRELDVPESSQMLAFSK